MDFVYEHFCFRFFHSQAATTTVLSKKVRINTNDKKREHTEKLKIEEKDENFLISVDKDFNMK